MDSVDKRNEVSEREVQRYEMFCEYMDANKPARAEFMMNLIFIRLTDKEVPEPYDIQVSRDTTVGVMSDDTIHALHDDFLILWCCYHHGCRWTHYQDISHLRRAYRPFDILTYMAAKWTRHYRECDFAQLALNPEAVGEWDIVTGLRV